MKRLVLLFYGCFLAIACIGEDYVDDYVEPNLRITNAILSIREAFSTSINLGLPTGEQRGGSDGSYQTGVGEFNQLMRFHIGKSYLVGKQRFYAKGSVGINQRSKGFSDEFRAGIETGTQLLKDTFLLLIRANTIQSFHNGSLNASNSNGSIFANNVEVVNLGGEVIYSFLPRLRLGVSWSYPISGQILYRAPALSAGISFQP